jgi:SNF2 family DNA or RNA helicase
MTGTHTLGDPRHVWAQHYFLAPFMTKSYWKFQEKYVSFSPYNEHIVVGYKNLDKLNKSVNTFAIVKDKKVLDLPPRTFHTIEVEPDRTMRKNYNDILDSEIIILPNSTPYEISERLTQIIKLQQVTGGFIVENKDILEQCDRCEHRRRCTIMNIVPTDKDCKYRIPKEEEKTVHRFKTNPKMDAMFEKLEEVLMDPDNQAVVWCRSREEIVMASERAHQLFGENAYTMLTGSMTNKQKQTHLERFETDPSVRLNIGQIQMGIGINELTKANYTFYFSLSTDLEHYLQSVDRNYRIGQDRNVTCYFLQVKGSVDVNIAFASENKMDVSKDITQFTTCVPCSRFKDCTEKAIRPYSDECVYSKKKRRAVIELERLAA